MSERLYTEKEVGRLQASEVELVLKGLLRSLEEVKRQRDKTFRTAKGLMARDAARQAEGLNIAIQAIRRRLR